MTPVGSDDDGRLHAGLIPLLAAVYGLGVGMVLAVEPKKGLAGIGLVGIENTFQVAPGGGVNLTEDCDEIVVV